VSFDMTQLACPLMLDPMTGLPKRWVEITGTDLGPDPYKNIEQENE
jgi:hypothetical protein